MSEKNKIPEIRFKGFGGEWKLQKLGKVVNLENGFAFNSKYFQDEKTDVIVLTPGSVNIGGGFQEGKGHFYDVAGDFPNKFIFKSGDIFVTMTDLTPTAQALGFPAVVPGDGNTYLHNQRLGKLTGFEGDKFFLFQLLSTEKKQKKIVLTSSGTTVKHTSPQKYLGCEICYPPKKEQTKIGTYFQHLDTLITLHQRKYDKLLKVKKAMLEKMFPKNGADAPEIRFKGFSEKWEERKLGNCVLIQRGGSPRPIEDFITDDKNGINWIKIGDVAIGSRYITKTKEKIIPEGEKHSRKVQKGDLILSNSMSFGRPYIMTIDGCIHDGWLLISNEKEVFNLEYLLQLLSSDYMLNQYRALASGGVVINLNSELVQSTNVFIPNKKEQTKIGNLFKSLDNLLTLHKKESEKLKNIKKACLEKMFV